MQYSRRQEYRSLSLQYAFPFLGLFLFREKRFALTADRKISSRTNDSSLYSGAFRLHCRSNIWEKRKAFLCRFPAALNAHANPITATRILALKGESPRRKVACKGRRCDMVAAAARGRNGARKKWREAICQACHCALMLRLKPRIAIYMASKLSADKSDSMNNTATRRKIDIIAEAQNN